MFERETKFITDFSLNKVKKLGAFFPYEKLAGVNLHPAILKYISGELDYLIYEDRQKLLSNSAFDYSGPAISRYFGLMSEEIKKSKRLSFQDAKSLIVQAILFNANYLVRPAWSLSKLIYNDAESRSVQEIKIVLSYLYYYDYIRNVFNAYFSKRKLVNLSRTEFEMILTKIDNELFASESQKLIDNAIYSITEFFNIGETNKNKVSASFIEVFLKDKRQVDYLARLRKAIPKEGRQIFDVEDIRKAIYTASPPETEFKKEPEVEIKGKVEPAVIAEPTIIDEPHAEETTDQIVIQEDEAAATDEMPEAAYEPPVEIEDDVSPVQDVQTSAETTPEEFESSFTPIEEKSEPEKVSNQEVDYISIYDEELKKLEEQSLSLSSELEKIDLDFSIEEHLKTLHDLNEELKREEQKILSDSLITHPEPETTIEIEDEIHTSEVTTEQPVEDYSPAETEEQKEPEDESIEIADDEQSPPQITDDDLNDIELSEDDLQDDLEPVDILTDSDDILIEEEPDLQSDYDIEEEKEELQIEQPPSSQMVERKKSSNKRSKDLFSFLSVKETDRIINEVFGEDDEDFTNTVEKIHECSVYDEATQILKDVYFSYRINPFTKAAITLTEAVENYFKQGN